MMDDAPPSRGASGTTGEGDGARPIEAHGVIGDQGTVALVADDGTVDFLCWPGFDSPGVFAALLDPARGGSFALAPVLDGARRRQTYFPDTNILLTRFSALQGVTEVTDFMPFPEPGGGGPRLVRRVRVIRDSRVMCWIAVDRAMRLATKRSLRAPLARWRETRDAISASVWDEFWDEERGHFVAAKGRRTSMGRC